MVSPRFSASARSDQTQVRKELRDEKEERHRSIKSSTNAPDPVRLSSPATRAAHPAATRPCAPQGRGRSPKSRPPILRPLNSSFTCQALWTPPTTKRSNAGAGRVVHIFHPMKLRLFLDYGGDILWPADLAAERKFGAPTDMSLLPLSPATKAIARKLSSAIQATAEHSVLCDVESQQIQDLFDVVRERIDRELSSTRISLVC